MDEDAHQCEGAVGLHLFLPRMQAAHLSLQRNRLGEGRKLRTTQLNHDSAQDLSVADLFSIARHNAIACCIFVGSW